MVVGRRTDFEGFYYRIYQREYHISDNKRAGRNMRTLRLTIARAGGSIVAQSCHEMVGDVAQLVERRNGIAEATGSTPVISTNSIFRPSRGLALCQKPLLFFQFRLH